MLSIEFNLDPVTYPEKCPIFTSLVVKVTSLRSQIWRLWLNGNYETRHYIHSTVNTDLKSMKGMIISVTGQFISSIKFKMGLWYSPLVKVTQSQAKVIHVAMMNDGFKIGPVKIWADES